MKKPSDVRSDVAMGRDVRVVPLAAEVGLPAVTLYSMIARKEVDGRKIGRVVIVPNAEARRVLGLPAATAETAQAA